MARAVRGDETVRATARIARLRVARVGPGLVVTVTDSHGQCGVGEASPLAGYSHESVDACQSALECIDPTRLTILEAEALVPQVAAHVRALASLPAAAFALETALLDLCAHVKGVPLHRLLAPATRASDVALNALVATEDEAARAVDAGFSCLKMKLARGDFATELALVHAVRQRVGPHIGVRLDANGGWSHGDACERLAMLRPLSPAYVEEPTRDSLALSAPAVPIALDESLSRGHVDFARCNRANVRAVILKPMKLGGALRCLELAARARAAGIEPVITHMMDGPIALAAATELAFAVAPSLACGLAPHANLRHWPHSAPLHARGATATPCEGPGHGATV